MEGKTALSAWFNAQKIALGPIIFQAARVLQDCIFSITSGTGRLTILQPIACRLSHCISPSSPTAEAECTKRPTSPRW